MFDSIKCIWYTILQIICLVVKKMSGIKDDIEKIISTVVSEVVKNSRLFDSKVYHDEPILKTARQLSNYVPDEIKKMRSLASSSYYLSENELFYRQGKLMESYEDDFEYHGTFSRYFPTYRSMDNHQLRGYFTFRTNVRKGIIKETSLSFAFVYIYELLNCIGSDDPAECFTRLKSFAESYGSIDEKILPYMNKWLCDFVIYNDLDPMLLKDISDTDFDRCLLTLINYKMFDDDELYEALVYLSSYNIENSKFAKKYHDDVKKVACETFKSLAEYYSKGHKKDITEKLFGRKMSMHYDMFGSAVFFDRKKYPDYEYKINDINIYRCKNGIWSCEKYYGSRGKNRELGAIIKAVDVVMRRKYDFKTQLKDTDTTKIILSTIEKETDKLLEIKKAKEAAVINIDMSKLNGIRRAAESTRDKLIVDTDDDFYFDIAETAPKPEEKPLAAEAAPAVRTQTETPLSETEYEFMHRLLYGGDYKAYLKEKGLMLSVVVDSVNEKLYDDFGDTVMLFDGAEPELIEDYIEELKGIVAE